MMAEEPVDTRTRRGVGSALVVVAVMGLLLSSCAAGPNPSVDAGGEGPGFWLGLWHGIILPVTFVISLFTDRVNIYEIANDGNWYDLGFVLGVMMSLGGGGAGAGRRRR